MSTVRLSARSPATTTPKENSATDMTAYAPNEANRKRPIETPSENFPAYGRPKSAKNMSGKTSMTMEKAGARMSMRNSARAC